MTVEIKKQKPQKSSQDFEARQNAVGFFDLLLKIDMRNNPQLYKNNKNDEDNRNTNNTD